MKFVKLQPKHIPNILTIFRIILVPVVITLMLVHFEPKIYTYWFQNAPITLNLNLLLAVIFFTIAALTDALDGYLARKFNWVSNFGKFWDPIADKILVNSTIFAFSAEQLNYIPVWIPLILLSRDLIVDGLRFVAAKQNIVIAANWPGKIKTIVLMMAVILIFWIGGSQNIVTPVYFWAIQNILFILSIILSVTSGIIYFRKYFQQKKNAESKLIQNQNKSGL